MRTVSGGAASGLRRRSQRWLPWLAGGLLGLLWFAAFHYRFHQGSINGSGVVLEAHPDLLRLSAPLFLVAFTVGSITIWMPCILQMVLVFSGLGAGGTGTFRGGWFFTGYIGTYAGLGLGAAALGEAFGRVQASSALQLLGGASICFIGLYVLGWLKSRLLRPCGSALSFAMRQGRLHRLGRVSTGVAFAAYCAGCCGPLLYPLFVFAAASGSALLGMAVAGGFALAMTVPIVILAVLGRRAISKVLGPLVENYALASGVGGASLLVFGSLLVLAQPLGWFIDAVHAYVGE